MQAKVGKAIKQRFNSKVGSKKEALILRRQHKSKNLSLPRQLKISYIFPEIEDEKATEWEYLVTNLTQNFKLLSITEIEERLLHGERI